MFKKTTFTLIAIGVLITASQSSAQTAKFKTLASQSAISQGKSCVRHNFSGGAVRDSKLNSMRDAKSNWIKKVRSSLSIGYANWSQAKRRYIKCRADGIEQNYRCTAVGKPCSKRSVTSHTAGQVNTKIYKKPVAKKLDTTRRNQRFSSKSRRSR